MSAVVTGLDEVREKLLALAARAGDLSPFLQREAASAQRYIDDAWSSRRSPEGRRWPRDRDGRSEGSGRLQRAHRTDAEADSLTITVSEGHASFQFFGTSDTPGRNPLPVQLTSAVQLRG